MATKKRQAGGTAVVRFTGDAGGTLYCYAPGKVLRKGETLPVELPLAPHWVQLLKSGNAELL